MPKQIIGVKHNIEVAHRLFELPGKCEAIHGHSMWVTLKLKGIVDQHGILEGVEFGALKKDFRAYLDDVYDHHVLLNKSDPWAKLITLYRDPHDARNDRTERLPGLRITDGDPTTENIARWVGELMQESYSLVHSVEVWETSVNMSEWRA